MIDKVNKSDCCGCSACMNICPKNAIKMVEDDKGFKYPYINKEKCINCNLCEKCCPSLNSKKIEHNPVAYAVMNNNDEIRLKSSSGGIFYLLAKHIITKNGIVFGVVYNKDFSAVNHIAIENVQDITKMMTSKYLQSNINNTYRECKKFLNEGRIVLFTGTPCQIEGLLSYLNKKYDNLITQDIICHGVPSPKIWRMYLNMLNKKAGQEVPVQTNFRQKNSGWNSYELSVKYTDSSYEKSHHDDIYMKAFLKDYILRDSCYQCKFKKYNRLSDITLADFWGIDNVAPDMNDNKGTSLVIISSNKGKELFEEIKEEVQYREVPFDESIQYNKSYYKSVSMPKNREKFFSNINENNFDDVVKKYIKKPMYRRIIGKGKRAVKKVLHRCNCKFIV